MEKSDLNKEVLQIMHKIEMIQNSQRNKKQAKSHNRNNNMESEKLRQIIQESILSISGSQVQIQQIKQLKDHQDNLQNVNSLEQIMDQRRLPYEQLANEKFNQITKGENDIIYKTNKQQGSMNNKIYDENIFMKNNQQICHDIFDINIFTQNQMISLEQTNNPIRKISDLDKGFLSDRQEQEQNTRQKFVMGRLDNKRIDKDFLKEINNLSIQIEQIDQIQKNDLSLLIQQRSYHSQKENKNKNQEFSKTCLTFLKKRTSNHKIDLQKLKIDLTKQITDIQHEQKNIDFNKQSHKSTQNLFYLNCDKSNQNCFKKIPYQKEKFTLMGRSKQFELKDKNLQSSKFLIRNKAHSTQSQQNKYKINSQKNLEIFKKSLETKNDKQDLIINQESFHSKKQLIEIMKQNQEKKVDKQIITKLDNGFVQINSQISKKDLYSNTMITEFLKNKKYQLKIFQKNNDKKYFISKKQTSFKPQIKLENQIVSNNYDFSQDQDLINHFNIQSTYNEQDDDLEFYMKQQNQENQTSKQSKINRQN